MIRLAEVRFKGFIPGLTNTTSTIVRDKDAELWGTDTQVLARSRKGASRDIIVPVGSTEYMVAAEPLEGVFSFEPEAPAVVPPPIPSPAPELPAENPHPTPISAIVNSVAEDTIRMVKIKGVVVERKGPPQDDELEELTKPRKSVAQMIAEADGTSEE